MTGTRWGMKRLGYAAGALASVALVAGAWSHRVPLDMTEVLGFITGALCVWLTVEQNVWNWPIGLANNAFFLILFLQSHLFGDMSLQLVYIVLGFLGWYWWLRGGPMGMELPVTRAATPVIMLLTTLLILGTAGLTVLLQRISDTAPLWDALTTVMSLIAQYMLTRKWIENWYLWIAADVIYVALYAYKHLYLTAGLYALFITMCLAGLAQWRASLADTAALPAELALGVADV